MPPNEYGSELVDEERVSPAMMICTKLAGRAIIRVVSRCENAKENNHLDLSECQLMQVPDAVYHLMRHTDLKTCNLANNVIAKIPPKFAVNFSHISDLNLSNNQMSRLPEELSELTELERLDMSQNSFASLPEAVYKMPKLIVLKADHNCIIDVEVERLERCPSIKDVNLEENPLKSDTRSALEKLVNIKISITLPEEDEDDWDNI